MRNELEAVRRDRRAIEEVVTRAGTGAMAVDAFNTIPAVKGAPDLLRVLTELSVAEAELRTLLTKYTEEYKGVKDLREKIATIRERTIPLYANALVDQLKVQENDLGGRIATMGRELRQIPTRSQNEARLRREVEQSEMLYRSLESSRQQARLAEASAIPDVRILDSAVVPSTPGKNRTPVVILIGLAAGLALGAGLALLIDRFDRRFRYPEQVSRELGLPILGTIPEIRHVNVAPEEAAQVIEAFRSIRLNLSHSYEPGVTIALAISSPSSGDGKSLVSSNLALSFAEAGYRTLLIDGDTRRGDLHRTFAVERRPGLLDYLAGDADQSAIVRPTSHPRLTLMPCGTRRREGPELLGSARMQDLMTVAKSRYDVIIVDTPPLSAGIDPFVLATSTGNLALVMRAGETDRQLAEAKLQVLDRLPVRLLGAVLNDVRVGEGSYKYYSYSYGYVSGDEEAAALPTGS
jgi:capsular exopolysaccharide synthesis family protein